MKKGDDKKEDQEIYSLHLQNKQKLPAEQSVQIDVASICDLPLNCLAALFEE